MPISYRARIHFFPLFASKKSTCLLTTGSYFIILNGRLVRGLTRVRKYPVIAIEIRRTLIVRDLGFLAISLAR